MDPLEKLKNMYQMLVPDPTAVLPSGPGDRLRAAAARLEAAIQSDVRDEAVAVGQQIDRELYHLERFMLTAEVDVPPSESGRLQAEAGTSPSEAGTPQTRAGTPMTRVELPQSQAVASRFQGGVLAHYQGWVSLGYALQNGDLALCTQAVQWADEGDRLLYEAEQDISKLKVRYPFEG